MKSLRYLPLVVLIAFSTVVFAQSQAHKSADQPAPTEAQKSFTEMKTLAGTWKGAVTMDPPQPDMKTDEPMWVSLRVTSRGNTLVHEMKEPGTPDDPSHDDPITTFYLDNDRLLLTHYCDAGNRPRMVARAAPARNKVEFDFLDVAGPLRYGHMQHAVFTIIDANHHTEDWTFMMPGDKLVHAHMDLQRAR